MRPRTHGVFPSVQRSRLLVEAWRKQERWIGEVDWNLVIRLFSQTVRWFSSWRRFCALLTLIFLVRGVVVLSVFPPLEGWDEYQHVAYIVFLLENDRPPVLKEGNDVPRSLYGDLVKYPHGEFALEQLRGIGALSYEAFWQADSPPAVPSDPPSIRLYQAQQSSFYYALVAPLYAWLSARGGLLAAMTGLRALNILFGGAALVLALWAVGRLVRASAHRYLLGLLIVSQPLFLLDCARVANDALALFLGTLTVVILLVITPRHYLAASVCAGLALGLGVLAKAINLGLAPLVAYVFVSMAWKKQLAIRRALIGLVVLTAGAAAISLHTFYFNLMHFGMLTPMQEAVQNRAEGRTLSDYIEAATQLDWWHEISRRYLRHSLWCGGWSMLSAPRWLVRLQQYSIQFAVLGGLFLIHRETRRKRWLFTRPDVVARLLALCLGMTGALCYHMLHSFLALPNVATNIWYAAVTFPWLLCLFYQGIAGFPRPWITHFLGAQMLILFLVTEFYGTLVTMVRKYTGHGWDAAGWDRLAALHLPGLGPSATLPALALAVVLLLLAASAWINVVRGGEALKSPGPAPQTGGT